MVAVCVMRWKHQWFATNSRVAENSDGRRQDQICTLVVRRGLRAPKDLAASYLPTWGASAEKQLGEGPFWPTSMAAPSAMSSPRSPRRGKRSEAATPAPTWCRGQHQRQRRRGRGPLEASAGGTHCMSPAAWVASERSERCAEGARDPRRGEFGWAPTRAGRGPRPRPSAQHKPSRPAARQVAAERNESGREDFNPRLLAPMGRPGAGATASEPDGEGRGTLWT